MAIRIHHATARKADKFGVVLKLEDDACVAFDPTGRGGEQRGQHPAALLDQVLAARATSAEDETDETASSGGAGGPGEPAPPPQAVDPPRASEVPLRDPSGTTDLAADDAAALDDPPVAPPAARSVVPAKYRERYKAHGGSNGDRVALALGEHCRSEAALIEVGRQNGIEVLARWGHLNPGQRRMCTGNMLRSRLRKGQAVEIGPLRLEPEPEEAPK
jgi:hypothetical protein